MRNDPNPSATSSRSLSDQSHNPRSHELMKTLSIQSLKHEWQLQQGNVLFQARLTRHRYASTDCADTYAAMSCHASHGRPLSWTRACIEIRPGKHPCSSTQKLRSIASITDCPTPALRSWCLTVAQNLHGTFSYNERALFLSVAIRPFYFSLKDWPRKLRIFLDRQTASPRSVKVQRYGPSYSIPLDLRIDFIALYSISVLRKHVSNMLMGHAAIMQVMNGDASCAIISFEHALLTEPKNRLCLRHADPWDRTGLVRNDQVRQMQVPNASQCNESWWIWKVLSIYVVQVVQPV